MPRGGDGGEGVPSVDSTGCLDVYRTTNGLPSVPPGPGEAARL